MSKTAVLHLMNGFKNASIGQIVKQVIQSLGSQDYQWYIGGLLNRGEMHAEYRQLGAVTIDFSNSSYRTVHSTRLVRQFLCEHPVQIIHTHTIRTLLVAWMATIGRPTAAGHCATHVATKHTLTAPPDRRGGIVYSPIDHISLYLPDYLVPVSNLMAQKILAQPWIKPDRVKTIPNAVPGKNWRQPEKRQQFRRQLGIDPQAIAIGFGGRFETVKRLDLLLEAFAGLERDYPDARLVLAGEGSLRSQLESQAAHLGISQAVIWAGFCQDMPGLLSALDIYIQTSINEGLPLSVLEAMAAEKPVIATRVGGTGEVIHDGEDGLLIPPLSPKAIQDALRELVGHPEIRFRLARNALQKVRAEFGVERMAAGYRQLYASILQ